MKKKSLSLISYLVLAVMLMTNAAYADDGNLSALIQDMQKQMEKMQKTIENQNHKIQVLESRTEIPSAGVSTSEPAPPMSDYEFNTRLETATGGASKWLKDLKFAGDLRLRYEGFNYDSGSASETDSRNRFRYRLRYGFEKKFSEDLMVGFSMASGEQSGGASVDPTSTNTTFDNNFNFKPIYVEKAFASYSPGFLAGKGILKNTQITGGKMTNPFEKGSSDMIWDRDVKPEGAAETINFNLLNTSDLDITAYSTFGQFVLDEDSAVGGDANLWAYQFGIQPTFYTPFMERPIDILQSVSFYDYSNYARQGNFNAIPNATTSLARGNSNVIGSATELDAGKFKVFESYSEIGLVPFMGIPSRVFFDWAFNPAENADPGAVGNGENQAHAFGLKLGSIVEKGDWEAGWAYKRIGANSVVGAFNDSDFGDGHAGKVGNVFKLGYALMDNVTLNSAMFFVRNLNAGDANIVDQEQRRFQVDLVWKF